MTSCVCFDSRLVQAIRADGSTRWATGAGQALATATVAAHATQTLASGEPGAHQLPIVTTAREIAPALEALKITITLS